MKKNKPTRKSNVIYFQIGLITALLLAIFMIENRTEINDTSVETAFYKTLHEEKPFIFHLPKKNPEVKQAPSKKRVSKKQPVQPIKNPVLDSLIFDSAPTTPVTSTKVDSIGLQEPVEHEEIEKLDFRVVEMVPVFPGCEVYETQQEIKSCFASQISTMIKRKFDGNLGAKLNLKGEQRIYLTFTVNKKGVVEQVKAKSKVIELSNEAIRVVRLLPHMKPGQQQNKKVAVTYSLPIIFEVH